MKFYWTKQPEYQDMLFMDSCKHRSIDSLLKSQETFLSPLNRLFLVYSAAQALRFIHKHSIIHLDIKPANILVGRNFLLRLTDFGESYHPQLCNSSISNSLCQTTTPVSLSPTPHPTYSAPKSPSTLTSTCTVSEWPCSRLSVIGRRWIFWDALLWPKRGLRKPWKLHCRRPACGAARIPWGSCRG